MTLKEAQSYSFIRRFSNDLARRVLGAKIDACISQNKNEWVLILCKTNEIFYLVINLSPNIGLMHLTCEFKRARKNVAHVFQPIVGKEIRAICMHQGERSFHMQLGDNYDLVFKIHGPNANVLLAHNGQIQIVARPKLQSDYHFDYRNFLHESMGWAPDSNVLGSYSELYQRLAYQEALQSLKKELLNPLMLKLKKNTHYIHINTIKVEALQQKTSYEQIANLLMAHIHENVKGVTLYTVHNFYTDSPIEIKLKPQLTLQENAAIYYKKSKKQKLEIANLWNHLQRKTLENEMLRAQIAEIHAEEDIRKLRKKLENKPNVLQEPKKKFHTYSFGGYEILAGKNAQTNDLLTFTIAHKNDVWLHAKDCAGSHVIIKHKAGKEIPKSVIEFAASVAALHAKNKKERWTRVSYTQKKFVRKPKGALPGSVVLEKEQTLLTEALKALPNNLEENIPMS